MEGIGYDFLDNDVADHWVKTDDDEAFAMCRSIILHEGLFIGGSCGSTMAGAYRFIKEKDIGKGKRVAVLFADSSRNYMSKFMDDAWLTKEGFQTDTILKAASEKGFYDKAFGVGCEAEASSTTGGAEKKGLFSK